MIAQSLIGVDPAFHGRSWGCAEIRLCPVPDIRPWRLTKAACLYFTQACGIGIVRFAIT
jgi:hypothetical protein